MKKHEIIMQLLKKSNERGKKRNFEQCDEQLVEKVCNKIRFSFISYHNYIARKLNI